MSATETIEVGGRAARGAAPTRVAVIDGDPSFVAALSAHATSAGVGFWRSSLPIEPATALAMKLDAMVVDPRALGGSALRYLEQMRTAVPDLGLLVCGGRSTVEERVRGLRLCADDWLTKPIDPEEVIARAQAVSRGRRAEAGPGEPFEVGGLSIHPADRRAFLAGHELELSCQEFDLLATLAQTTGEVLARKTIYRRAWGYAMAPGDRSVDTFVARLRAKLASIRPDHTYIHTHFRIGYRFEP
jgi:DNA-binding response OmpR family regulator